MKLFIAKLLDRFPQTCWTNLYLWSIGTDNIRNCFNQECRKSNKSTPNAYCNKCEITKRFYDEKKNS